MAKIPCQSRLKVFFSKIFQDYEYLLIDGGSKDGTIELIQTYAKKSPSIAMDQRKGQWTL